MRPSNSPIHLLPPTLLSLIAPTILASSTLQLNSGDLSKRGLCYIGTKDPTDYNLFTSPSSPLTWYYNYASSPALPSSSSLQYTPMIHSLDNLDGDISAIRSQRDSVSHILVFNEPDGSTGSGGSNIDPKDAAKAYINDIMPMRLKLGVQISLPATTGSSRGIEWLQDFNSSCYKINNGNPCEFDFIAAHWYGDFPGLASWLGTLHAMYPKQKIWLTEFALPKASAGETQVMMNASLPYLDGLGYVERYAWFGAFRSSQANEWTGDGVSLLDKKGGLTGAGAVWLGGSKRGFEEGEKADGSMGGGSRSRVGWSLMLGLIAVVGWWVCSGI